MQGLCAGTALPIQCLPLYENSKTVLLVSALRALCRVREDLALHLPLGLSRIRLKVALIDIRTGDWSVFSPKSFEQARFAISPRRGAVDQKQVERLKKHAYEAAVAEMVAKHSEVAVN